MRNNTKTYTTSKRHRITHYAENVHRELTLHAAGTGQPDITIHQRQPLKLQAAPGQSIVHYSHARSVAN